MIARTQHPTPIPPLPGERAFVGRMGVVAGVLGVLADLLLWLASPDEVTSEAVLWGTLVATALVTAACATLRWERLPQRLIQLPVGLGLVLVAAAMVNTGGADSPLSVFTFVIPLVLAYAGTLPQVLGWAAAAVLVQLSPLLYEEGEALGLVAGAAVRGLSGLALAVALQRLRHRVRTSAALERAQALRDEETGAVSPEGLAERLGAEIARARRHDQPLAVLAVELDAGAASGARQLRAAADAIEATLRGEDVVARTGHRSFTVVLPGAEPVVAARVAARIAAALDRRSGACRIGLAAFPQDGPGAIELQEAAARDAAAGGSALLPAAAQAGPADAPVPWPVRGPVLAAILAVPVIVAAWLAVPALRMPLLMALLLGSLGSYVYGATHLQGRERRGWRLMALGCTLAYVPWVGAAGFLVLVAGVLVAAGRNWHSDRVRTLDGITIASAIAGLLYSLLLRPTLDDASARELAIGITAAVGAGATATAVLIAAVTVPLRRRPDVVALLVVLLGGAGLLLPYALVNDATIALGDWWELATAITALPALVALAIRLRGPRRAVIVEAPAGDPGAMVWCGTILLALLCGSTLLVHGELDVVVGVLLLCATLLRGLRFQLVHAQRARFATLARHHDAVRAEQQRASLEALARALEARDGYTGRHGEETVEIAVRVAAELGLDEDEVAEVETVALLHDIGKIGIPNDILHKDGPLDDEEWERMREHPVIGERILRAVPGLERVADAVRHEHERWDGGGYPDGIAGEAIPLASRITLVCDAWHAMTSDRPYRKAMPLDDAVEQLLAHAGEQFDRAVVRALLRVLEREGVSAASAAHQAAA